MDILNRVSQIESLNTLDDVWIRFEKIAKELGYDFFIYTISNHNSNDFYYYDNFGLHPKDENEFYDPFLDFCCKSYDTTFTGHEFITDYNSWNMPKEAYQLVERGRTLGMISGLGIPIRLKGSNRYGGFNLGTNLKRSDFENLIEKIKEPSQLACMLVHRHIEALLDNQNMLMEQPVPPIEPYKPDPLNVLTSREKHILDCLAKGASRKQSARELSLSEGTVSTHIKNIYRKLGVHNKVEATKLAIQQGDI